MTQGSRITRETRQEGYQAILPQIVNIQESCLEAVRSSRMGLTAEEVQAIVGCSLNCARSRLTELFKAGRLVVISKKPNAAGTCNISIYSLKTA